MIETSGLLAIDAGRHGTAPRELECEVRLRRHDGAYRWHLVRTVPLVDADGAAFKWIATGTDIEERKAAEMAIAVAHDAALASTEAKSRFLATMSHEIRTPMSGVIGMADLLLLTEQTPQQREYTTVVRESSRTLLRVLNDILDYSKIEAGKLELEAINFELRSQVDSVVELLAPQYRTKGVTLTTRLASDLATFVAGDPGRLRQIILNLASNALKLTPSGGSVTVSACSESTKRGAVCVRFTVADTGIGIAPSDVERLFEPFSQADESTSRKYGGTGLGLSITAQLVALIKGTIGVDSVPDTGSTFWFIIPFAVVAAGSQVTDVVAPQAVFSRVTNFVGSVSKSPRPSMGASRSKRCSASVSISSLWTVTCPKWTDSKRPRRFATSNVPRGSGCRSSR